MGRAGSAGTDALGCCLMLTGGSGTCCFVASPSICGRQVMEGAVSVIVSILCASAGQCSACDSVGMLRILGDWR